MSTPLKHLISDIDLFSDGALHHPYALFRQLRDLGPAAYLSQQGLWFIGRYEEARTALGDWQTWSSAQGIGLNPVINEAWASALICTDPPVHTEQRKLFMDRLGPRQLKPLDATITQRAEELAERIVQMQTFDAVKDVAQDLPVNVIMDLIGWPEAVRGGLLELANGSFNACGPDNDRMRGALPQLDALMQFVSGIYDAGTLVPGGFGSTIADAAKRGDIPREAAIGLLVGYVVAAFDTTISAMTSGVMLFAQNPEQWDLLRADETLAAAAFNEILRMESPIQHFSRVATRDVDLGEGAVIQVGQRALISYASANRDERHFPYPERFDITRRPLDHLAFGLGNHGCAGQGLARLEGHAVFKALAKRVKRFELVGEPMRGFNNITRNCERVMVRAVC
ncbi:cytochrome P450 [Rhodoferax ferrireducens]|uniref:cytochrome P450 n=1 Tax=Rhodoferax ferrireducens TaxID=192843 RepID=UPI000E0D2077|nr:cytochrome P450 [Rhodoferax ferrireducens]